VRAAGSARPFPAGISGLSFGLSVFSNGTLITDGYRFAPAPAQTTQVAIVRVALLVALLAIAAALARWLIRRRRTARVAATAGQQAGPPGGQMRERPVRSSSSR
jgi:hypothetical protein